MSWNFHGHIALPLEEYSRNYFGSSYITADEIESGKFVETMLLILSKKFGSQEKITDFFNLCSEHINQPASKIPTKKVKELFDEFKRLEELYI